MDKVREVIQSLFFHSPRRTVYAVFGTIIMLALPITLLLVQQQQDLRQRAAFTPPPCTTGFFCQNQITINCSPSTIKAGYATTCDFILPATVQKPSNLRLVAGNQTRLDSITEGWCSEPDANRKVTCTRVRTPQATRITATETHEGKLGQWVDVLFLSTTETTPLLTPTPFANSTQRTGKYVFVYTGTAPTPTLGPSATSIPEIRMTATGFTDSNGNIFTCRPAPNNCETAIGEVEQSTNCNAYFSKYRSTITTKLCKTPKQGYSPTSPTDSACSTVSPSGMVRYCIPNDDISKGIKYFIPSTWTKVSTDPNHAANTACTKYNSNNSADNEVPSTCYTSDIPAYANATTRTDLTLDDIKNSDLSCEPNTVLQMTKCSFTLPPTKNYPTGLRFGIGAGTMGGNCPTTATPGTKVTCPSVNTGSTPGTLPIYITTSTITTKSNTNKTVVITAVATSPTNTPTCGNFTCEISKGESGTTCASDCGTIDYCDTASAACSSTLTCNPGHISTEKRCCPTGQKYCSFTNTCSTTCSAPTATSQPVATATTVPQNTQTPVNGSSPTATTVPATATTVPPTSTTAPTATTGPTATTMPTATIAQGDTALALSLKLPGIGIVVGDNVDPKRKVRTVNLAVYNSTKTTLIADNKTGTLTFNSVNGRYEGKVSLGNSLATGNYTVVVKMDNTLRKQLPGNVTITAGSQNNTAAQISLVSGDVDQNNSLSVNDYNIVVACFKGTAACTESLKVIADINDNGVTLDDLDDFAIMQRGFAIRDGD